MPVLSLLLPEEAMPVFLFFLTIATRLHTAALSASTKARRRRDAGQTTAEYALVVLGAATVALLLVAWAAKTNRIGKLFDWVLDEIVGRAR